MIIRALDTNDDWTFGKGKNDYKRNIAAINENVVTRLKSWKNDCFFALNEGVDYDNYLDYGRKNFLDFDVKRVILQSEGVLRIDEFESTIVTDEREYTATAYINTIAGNLRIII